MSSLQLIGSTLGLSLLAGIRLYATVLAIGLVAHFNLIRLPAALDDLRVLGNKWVMLAAAVGCICEFLADKIPWFDSVWDSAHTFIRPIGAALLGATALGDDGPVTRVLIALACGGVAFTGHSSKAATRLLINHSPEPFTNVALSVMEDAAVPVGVWISVKHPYVSLCIVVVFLVVFAWLAPRIFRSIRLEWKSFAAIFRKFFLQERQRDASLLTAALPKLLDPRFAVSLQPLPGQYAERLGLNGPTPAAHCAAGRGVAGLFHSIGYLCVLPDELVFITRRLFRWRTHRIPVPAIAASQFLRGMLLDTLSIQTEGREEVFDIFKVATRSAYADHGAGIRVEHKV
jgi:uncharacterized membrane protein